MLLSPLAQRPMCPRAHRISLWLVLTEEEVLSLHRKILGRPEKVLMPISHAPDGGPSPLPLRSSQPHPLPPARISPVGAEIPPGVRESHFL